MANENLKEGIDGPIVVPTGAPALVFDQLPLSTGWDAGRRDVEMKRPDVFRLVLEPRKSAWPLSIGIILGLSVVPTLGLVFTLLPGFERNASWGLRALCITLSAIFTFFVLLILLTVGGRRRWFRFDRVTGVFTISRRPTLFWRPLELVRSRPLADLVGVQVIDCGWQDYSLEIGEPGTPGSVVSGQSHGYQLNLLLNDETESRLNIARHSDAQWMDDAGRGLANFLDVPFFDRKRADG